MLGPQVEAHIRRRGSIRLRRIHVESWESPVVSDQHVTSLPQLWLYVDGKLVTKSRERVMGLLAGS